MKYLTFLLIFAMTVTQPLAVFAVTETPDISPTPAAEEAITETPVPEPSLTPETELSPSPEELISAPPVAITEITPTVIPTIEMTTDDLIKSEQSTEEASPSSELVVETTPLPTITVTAPVIRTGNAENIVTVDNVINTTITGIDNCMLILSHNFDTQDIIDLTDNCQNLVVTTEPSSDEKIQNFNEAEIQTTVQAIADTGKNVLFVSEGSIVTGDSRVQVDLFNLINTNITGTNTFFGVVNLFDPQVGDIILPYELDYVLKGYPVAAQSSQLEHKTEQAATVLTDIDSTVTTGDNTGAEVIKTGNAISTIRLYDKVNTSILRSNFLILEINNFGSWDGELIGWWGDVMMKDNQIFALYNGLSTFDANDQTVQNENTATVINSIQVYANTGENSAVDAQEISTGNAEAKVNVFDFMNTNITGNNWYHVVVNIFDSFKGNIIFPRPDLGVTTSSNKNTITQGEEITLTTHYFNRGLLWAKDTFLVTELPSNLEFIEASPGGIFENGKIRWELGKIETSDTDSVWIKARSKDVSTEPVNARTYISTSTDEPSLENNENIIQFLIRFFQTSSEESEQQNAPAVKIVETYLQRQTLQLSHTNAVTVDKEVHDVSGANKDILLSSKRSGPNVYGAMTKAPMKKAQAATPSMLLLVYLFGSIALTVKGWLEE